MKKILLIITSVVLTFTLVGCWDINDFIPEPDENINVVAPGLTQEELDFIDHIDTLKPSGVSITAVNYEEKMVRASGVIVKKEPGLLKNKYYVITVMDVAHYTDSIKVYVSSSTSYSATLLNPTTEYEEDENIAVLKFETADDLVVKPLIAYEGQMNELTAKLIFSISTPISNAYFNMVTNPAAIMGVRDNIIIHGTNLSNGDLGSPLYLKESGFLIGINVKYSTTTDNNRPEVLINHALFVNRVIELVEGYL